VKLFEEFNRLITNNEENQFLLQVVVVNKILFAPQEQRSPLLTQCLQFLDSKTEAGVEVIKPEQSTFMVRTMYFFNFWTFPIFQTY